MFAEGNVYAITSALNVTSKYCKVMKEVIKAGMKTTSDVSGGSLTS